MGYMRLFPPQQEILEHGILDLGFSSVLCLPTGSGKTTLAEMGIDRALARGEKVAYLTPLKALAEEKIASWGGRWPAHRVGIFTGDYEGSATPVPYRDADVLICTYERLDGVLRHWQRHLGWLSRLGLVVVDEFHLITDPGRGPRLEGAISRLKRVNPFCRVMGLSATASNHTELAAWLDGVSYQSTWRPVSLRHEVRRFKNLADKPGLVIDLVAETARENGQTLVFVSSRRRAEQLAAQVSAAGYSAYHHHAGLEHAQRKSIEDDFRSGRSICLVATPTLEMGLNLPCRTVVIADSTRWNGESFEPLPVWNYLQRAGRAGRPGQDCDGRAVLLAPTWSRGLPDYARAEPEPIRSHLAKPAVLAEQILIEAASRSCRTKAQLSGSFLPSTLAYRQDPSIACKLSACVDELLSAGLIHSDSAGGLNPTRVGWVAVRHQMTPATAKHLLSLRNANNEGTLTSFDLLLHHCWTSALQPQLPPLLEVVDELEGLIEGIPSRYLDAAPPEGLPPRACAAGVVMAVLAWMYAQGQDPAQACDDLGVYLADAQSLRENLVRLLGASADLHTAADPITDKSEKRVRDLLCGPSLASRLARLRLQLEFGLPGDSVYLTMVPGCGGLLARRLFDAGIQDLEDLCNAEPSDLAVIPGIGPKRSNSWIQAAEQLMSEMEPDPIPKLPKRSRGIDRPSDWPVEIDPGRLQRATLLEVSASLEGYLVSGGAEVHKVLGNTCDCADYAQHDPGWWCKHRLAVRIRQGDKQLEALVARLGELERPSSVAGHLAELTLGRSWKNG